MSAHITPEMEAALVELAKRLRVICIGCGKEDPSTLHTLDCAPARKAMRKPVVLPTFKDDEQADDPLRQHRLEWASWLESWHNAADAEPPTIQAVINWLRADSLPFGCAQAER